MEILSESISEEFRAENVRFNVPTLILESMREIRIMNGRKELMTNKKMKLRCIKHILYYIFTNSKTG